MKTETFKDGDGVLEIETTVDIASFLKKGLTTLDVWMTYHLVKDNENDLVNMLPTATPAELDRDHGTSWTTLDIELGRSFIKGQTKLCTQGLR